MNTEHSYRPGSVVRLVHQVYHGAYCVRLNDRSGYIVWPGKVQPRGCERPAIGLGTTARSAWLDAWQNTKIAIGLAGPIAPNRRGDHSLPRQVRRWRKSVPDRDGWWLWREDYGRDRTERLLIVCGRRHSEVAGDDEWEQATGKPAEHDGWVENYWEGTDTKTMGGYWLQETPNAAGERLPAKNV